MYEEAIYTLFGFLLFVLWDFLKGRMEARHEKRRITSMLQMEIMANQEISKKNRNILTRDLTAHMIEKEVVITPIRFSTTAWNIVRAVDIVSMFDNATLRMLGDSYVLVDWINANMSNRDALRFTGGCFEKYPETMAKHDQVLLGMMSDLDKKLESLLDALRR